MKKLLTILFLFSVAYGQVEVDSTKDAYVPDRDGIFKRVPSTAFGLDKVRAFEINGEIYERFNTGTWQNNHFGIYANGANQRAKFQAAFDSSYVDKMVITNDQGGAIFLQGDSIDFHGKTLEFEGNVYLKGDPANKTKLKNVMIVADPTSFIIDTSFVLGENVKFTTGEFSVKNFGAGKDRTFKQNMAIITMLNDYAGLYKGQTIFFPGDNYLVGRRGTKMIPGKSYTTYKGEGMYKTKLTLDTADYYNFRRIFDLNDGDSSITIKDMGFNMNLKGIYYDSVSVDFEGDPGEPAGDYQCLPIFTYSTDSTKAVFDVRIENIYAENIPGDVVGISKNTNYVHIKNIRFRNYIRQGISLGGGNVRDVWIEDVFDLGSTTVVQVGGHSIHCEPSSIQWNINYLNSTVRDFSYSGVGSGSIIGITTTSNNDLLCNLISNTEISDNTLNGRLQVSANSRGNIKINNNRELNAGVTFTTVSGASGSPAPSFITGNKKITGINAPAIQLLNVDSITVGDNNVQNTGDATISAGNCRSTIITRNRVKKNGTGNYPGIYTYSTTTSNYGAGMDYIDGNIVESSYRGIVVGNKSAIIGPANVVTAPTPYELSTAKIFPYRGPDGRQTLVYKTSGLPNYNDWVKGDVIIVNTTTAGEPTKYICDTTGALHRGNWNAVGPYYRNEYVRDSTNGRVYRSKASNGQNELPSADTDNTYWEQVATRTAVFSAVEYYRQLLSGYGAPTMTNNIAIGTEYIRKDGDSCTTKYIYTVNGWRPNSGCGGPGGGLSAGEVGDQIGDSLTIYRGNDTITVLFARVNDDSIKLVMNGVQFKLYSPLVDSLSIVDIINAQPEYVVEPGEGVPLLNDITGTTSKRVKGLLEGAGVILNDDTASVTIALDLKTLGGQDIKGAGNIAVTATKNTARDSIIITIGSLRLAFKDSTGSVSGVGSGVNLVKSGTEIKSITGDTTLVRTSNTNDVDVRLNPNLLAQIKAGTPANVRRSIEKSVGDSLQLANDQLAPGISRAYGTSPLGVKGYQEIEENFLGTKYEKYSWANLSDFHDNNASASVSGGNITFTLGAGTFAKTLDITNATASGYTMLNNWKAEMGFVVNTKDANSFGIGIGVRSYNPNGLSNALGRFVATNTSDSGKVIINGGTDNSTAAISSTGISFSTGDSIILTVELIGASGRISVTAQNFTKKTAPVTTSYSYTTVAPFMANTGRFSIFNFGGSQTMYYCKITSKDVKNARVMVVGDSKTQRYLASSPSNVWGSILNSYYRTTVTHAGGYDRTAEVLLALDEVIELRPQQVILNIGSNDVRFGVSSTTYRANYDTIVARLTRAGIKVFHTTLMYETGANQSTLISHIRSNYNSSDIIETYDKTNCYNCLSGDAVHPTDNGQLAFATAIIESAKIYGGNNRYGSASSISGQDNYLLKINGTAAQQSNTYDNGTSLGTNNEYIRIENNDPKFVIRKLNATTDQKEYRWVTGTNYLRLNIYKDDLSNNSTFVSYYRTADQATSIVHGVNGNSTTLNGTEFDVQKSIFAGNSTQGSIQARIRLNSTLGNAEWYSFGGVAYNLYLNTARNAGYPVAFAGSYTSLGYLGATSTYNERLLITTSGLVGIRRASPAFGFHVGTKMAIDSTPAGTAGTDSILVKKSDGSIGVISPSYYSTSGGSVDTTVVSTKWNVTNQINQAVQSGVWTPTSGNEVGVTSSSISANSFMYQRIGGVVSFSGTMGVTPSAATFELSLTMPFASAFTNGIQCTGAVVVAVSGISGDLSSDYTNDKIHVYVNNVTAGIPIVITMTGHYIIQ